MALTANTLPSIPPDFVLPIDALTQFAAAQTLTATGYVNNVTAQLDLGLGRFTGMLALDISALDQTTGDETYNFVLMGSNDVNWGNGNVEALATHDIGGTTHRVVATILGDNTALNLGPHAGRIIALPFTNFMGSIVYRYSKLYAVLAGTTPSVTLSAWISPITMKV